MVSTERSLPALHFALSRLNWAVREVGQRPKSCALLDTQIGRRQCMVLRLEDAAQPRKERMPCDRLG
jgi:hypothetical protein